MVASAMQRGLPGNRQWKETWKFESFPYTIFLSLRSSGTSQAVRSQFKEKRLSGVTNSGPSNTTQSLGRCPPHPPRHHCWTSPSLRRLQADSQEAPSPQSHSASALPGTRAPNRAEADTWVLFNTEKTFKNSKMPRSLLPLCAFNQKTSSWELSSPE